MGSSSSTEAAAAGAYVGPLSVEVGERKPGEGRARRHPLYKDTLLALPFDGEPDVDTCHAIFQRAVRNYGDRPCLGERITLPGGVQKGPYEFETYAEVEKQVKSIGSALRSIGLNDQDPVGIFSINRQEWVKALLGIWSQNFKSVPVYDTLGATATSFIVNHAELSVLFVSKEKFPALVNAEEPKETLKFVVQFEAVDDEQREICKSQNIEIFSLAEFMARGDENPVELKAPAADDLAYIMYTSGTTGNPKGVLLSHKNIVASVSGVAHSGLDVNTEDVYLSYLPLAHSFETIMQIVGMTGGASVGFYQGDIRKLTDDIATLRPTLFAGVPRVYTRVFDKTQQAVAGSSWLKRTLYEHGYEAQLENVRKGTRSGFWDSLVFSNTKQRLGGRVRLMATGAAPMPAHVHEFLKVAFGCPVVQGYGMTENAAAAVICPINYTRVGSTGGPMACTEVKLVDVPEMNYTSDDKPFPRGEILLRGANIFQGYHKQPEKTKEALEEDGWLHTGDIGQWNEDGSLSIIDRKKNIFKLSQGEFVAAEELENIFSRSDFIGQIFIYGNSFKTAIVAVIVPAIEVVEPWAVSEGLKADNYEELCKLPQLKEAIMADIKKLAKEDKLAGFKVPKDIHIEGRVNDMGQGFTVENDCLTPTFKLRRPQTQKRYQAEIDTMYATID